MDSEPLDIAFVVMHTSPLHQPGTKDAGGMNVVVLAQAEELAREGHRVRLITRRSDPRDEDSVELAPRLSVVHLDAGPARLLAKGDHEALIPAFRDALAAHLAIDPAELIHAEHWYSGVAALPVARKLGVPLLQSYHSIAAADDTPLAAGERAEAPGRLAGERMLAQDADAVVTVSEAERATVIARLGGSPNRVHVVVPGVDTVMFHPLATATSADPPAHPQTGRPEAVVAGRLHPLKGFDLAIAAIARVSPELRPVLRIIGSPPPDGAEYVQSLHDAIARAGLESDVIFEGALGRAELAKRLREAALVLIPSHSETYGLVALEAAASGVPVVARATGGLLEAVSDGVTGLLVADPADPPTPGENRAQGGTSCEVTAAEASAWAAAIEQIMGDADLAARMRIAGREHALAHNWEISTASLLQVYRGLPQVRVA